MNLKDDLHSAFRILLHEPGFAALTVLTVALGVGANTAIFSIVNGVLLRPLPYANPERLVSLREVIPALAQTYPTLPASARHFMEWRQRASSFEHMSALTPATAALTGSGEPEQVDTVRVSADLFDTLGVRPAIGRAFAAGEDQAGRNRVVLLADSLWRRRFHAARDILGRTIQLDSQPYTVIGILPAWFRFPDARILDIGQFSTAKPEVFRPLVIDNDELKELMGGFNYSVLARLKPGVAPARASAEMNVIARQLMKLAATSTELRAAVLPLRDSIVGKSSRGLWVLLAAVGSVLLIGCVNLANLLLARSERRARDMAVRAAIGASGARLAWHALVETLFLSALGGILGVAAAAVSLGALLRAAPADIPRLDEVRLDPWVLLFAFGITALTGLIFGLAPAWRARRVDPQGALKSGGRTLGGGLSGARLRGLLVAIEVGMSVVLLMAAGLLIGSFARILHNETGFRAPTVLAGHIQIPEEKYQEAEQCAAFHQRLLDHLRSQPGVLSAAVVTALPLTGETWIDMVSLPGDTRPMMERPMTNVRFASADYFRTMGIPLVAGRTFRDDDRTRRVAVISERVAQTLWPGRSAVGRQFIVNEKPREVIGVVGDVLAQPHRPAVAIMYRPIWDTPTRRVELVARAAGDPRSLAGLMRAAIRSADPGVPLPEFRTMREVLAESLAQRRFSMLLILSFAATALLLAALGIYGVVSYSVTRRRGEMGIRMALGAEAPRLCAMVVRQAMIPVGLGLLAGLAAALAAGRVLASMLFEISPRDPVILAAVAGVLLAVSLFASFVPARRAAATDPLEALRME